MCIRSMIMRCSAFTKRSKMPLTPTESCRPAGTRYGPNICGRTDHEPTARRAEGSERVRVSRGVGRIDARGVRTGRGAIRPACGWSRGVREMVRTLPRSRSHPPGHQRPDREIPRSKIRRAARMAGFGAGNSQLSGTAWDFGDAAVSQDRDQRCRSRRAREIPVAQYADSLSTAGDRKVTKRGSSMSLVGFGQPDDGIIQICYLVPDIRAAMNLWIDKLKVGPWFLLDHFSGTNPKYRGRDSKADVSLAMSFAGHMNIELIQPNDAEPSVYREWIEKRGYGFHHWGRATTNFDRDVAHYQAQGHELAFLAGVPSGGSVAYMDTTAQLPGYMELIELGAGFEAVFSKFYRASIGWDGADPVRSFI